MTFTDKHIVQAYSEMLEGLDPVCKLELIGRLSRSLKKDQKKKEKDFFKTFGSFPSDLSAEGMVAKIKADRRSRQKDIRF